MSQRFTICVAFIVYLAVIVKTVDNQEHDTNANQSSTSSRLLKVKVYYEALCGDSENFIRGQLKYVMRNLDYQQYTDLEFVPYGKVWMNKNEQNVTTLYCQHGRRECELNALHACIIENNSYEERNKLIICLMSGNSLATCSRTFKIDVQAALSCSENRSIPDILKKYGDDTSSLVGMTFIPAITIDGEFNKQDQYNIRYNFGDFFCRKYYAKYDIMLRNCEI